LLMTDADLREDGRFKMNPPLRSAEDRDALIEGIKDGTIDMIATDHAPHSAEEKCRGLTGSAFGVTGIEVAFPVCYTGLVKTGILTLEALVKLLSDNPRKRFGIRESGYSLWDLNSVYTVDSASFLSMGRSTPFEGCTVCGKNLLTSTTIAPYTAKRSDSYGKTHVHQKGSHHRFRPNRHRSGSRI
ncbi:MAG: hypothetical protein KBS46_07760, partial [Clostridiales bacterium]|nr:hypothetical protein [Candidatus Apopatocola equi]